MGHPFPTSLEVARGGFEPPLTGPKPAVLPLDDRALLLNGRLQIYQNIYRLSRLQNIFH